MEKQDFFDRNFDKIIIWSFVGVFLLSYTYKIGQYYYDFTHWFFLFGLLSSLFYSLGILLYPASLVLQTYFFNQLGFLPANLTTIYTLLMVALLLLFISLKKFRLNKDINFFLILALGTNLLISTLANGLAINFQNYEFIHFIDAIIVFLVITTFMCSEKKVRALSWILLFVVASVAFRLYSHVYSYDQAFEGFENNYLARILSFYVPFLLGMLWAEKKKLFKFFIFAVFAFTLQGITQLGSRATYVAVGIALALLGIMNLNKKSTWIFAGLGVIFFMFFVPPIFYRDITSISYAAEGTESEEYSIRGRAIAAEYGMKIFSEQPITGFGVAQARYEKLLEERFGLFKSGHNAFVIIAVELGIFGLLIYISLFAVSILYCFRARIMTRKTNRYISSLANGTMFGLIGIGINQFMLNNPWIPTAFIGFALSSVLYTLAKEQKKKDLEKIAKSEEKPEIKTEKKK